MSSRRSLLSLCPVEDLFAVWSDAESPSSIYRLDRTVRTLRYYMEMLWLASEPKENNWYKLFQMAVWVHNNSSHRFSQLPPQYLISAPGEMRRLRRKEYIQRVWNYGDFLPYLRIKQDRRMGKYPVGLPDEDYFVEVNKDKPDERFRYLKMMKAPDRHLYNLEPRKLRYVVGNRFMLQGDDINTEREPDEKRGNEVMTQLYFPKYQLWRFGKHTILKRQLAHTPIRWKGLWDKNSNKLYSLDQLLPGDEHTIRYRLPNENRAKKYKALFDR